MNPFSDTNFTHFELKLEINSNLDETCLSYPGVIGVYNVVTNRVFFLAAEHVLVDTKHFFNNVLNNVVDNSVLLTDLKSHGPDSFKFFVLEAGLEVGLDTINSDTAFKIISSYKKCCRDHVEFY